MKKIIYIVGNPIVDEDSTPFELMPLLRKKFSDIEFCEFDPTENLPEDTKMMILIDTVKGLDEPKIFTDIDKFITDKTYSLHDFDLGWQLKLYKKLGMISDVRIIGIPETGDLKDIENKVTPLISSLFSKSE